MCIYYTARWGRGMYACFLHRACNHTFCCEVVLRLLRLQHPHNARIPSWLQAGGVHVLTLLMVGDGLLLP